MACMGVLRRVEQILPVSVRPQFRPASLGPRTARGHILGRREVEVVHLVAGHTEQELAEHVPFGGPVEEGTGCVALGVPAAVEGLGQLARQQVFHGL